MAGYATLPRLLDTARLRAAGLGLRADPVTAAQSHDSDPELIAAVTAPFETVDGVLERLRELERRLRAADDRRAVFLTVYTRMTAAVRDALDTFDDPAWMRRYTVTFADYYRRAFRDFERGRPDAVPDPWMTAFSTAVEGSALVAQDAFLGINAHINYDLALTLRDVGIDPHRRRKRADHDRIDDVLAALIDAQQAALADLYAPGLADVDVALGRFDETLSLFSMTEGRAQAWRIATVLTDVPWAVPRRYARWVLRTTATGGAAFVRSRPVDPCIMAALRDAERGVTLDDALSDLGSRLERVTGA
jgi:hypothetical protein